MYSIFYSEIERPFFQLKTDYETLEEAEMFIHSDYFRLEKLKFDFLLKDGMTLIMGSPLKNSNVYFKQAMMFALDIPKTEYLL